MELLMKQITTYFYITHSLQILALPPKQKNMISLAQFYNRENNQDCHTGKTTCQYQSQPHREQRGYKSCKGKQPSLLGNTRKFFLTCVLGLSPTFILTACNTSLSAQLKPKMASINLSTHQLTSGRKKKFQRSFQQPQ